MNAGLGRCLEKSALACFTRGFNITEASWYDVVCLSWELEDQ